MAPHAPQSKTTNSTRLSRRQLLQVGGVSALGLALPQVLSANAAAAGRAGRGEKSCIFIFQYGGLSQLDSWDPKPNGPQEIRGPYKPIATSVPGFQVGELMPRLAKQAHQYCVIRSMSHRVPVHDVANRMLLAGQSQPTTDAPSFGSIVTKLKPIEAAVPPYVWLQKFGGGAAPPDPSYLTGGFLGVNYAPLLVGASHDDNPATPGYRVKALDFVADMPRSRIVERRELLDSLPTNASPLAATSPARKMTSFRERAFEIITGDKARGAFDVDQEPAAMRDRYGRHPLGQNLLLARRLVEAGVRLVSVVGWTGLAPSEKFLSVETWDMHGNAGISIFDNGWNGLGFALPRADEAVSALLADLSDRGLLDSTLVVLVGEFGRTPKISKGAKAIGRDHWPNCYSAMLAGAGIRGGAVYGASDHQAAYVQEKPVSPEDFAATLFHALDIPPETRIGLDGFTRSASSGEVVREIF